jgi:Sec7-like guanine-nucleotide exchange factor
LYNFENSLLIDALRTFTSTFYLKGEGQMITRVLETFSERYYEQNPDIYPNSDCIHLLTTALVMLNTDLHNPQNAGRRMTKSQFVRNTLFGLKDMKIENISESLLEDMYNSIKRYQLVLLDEDSAISSQRKGGIFLRRRDSVKGSVKVKKVYLFQLYDF